MKEEVLVGTITLRLGLLESTWIQGHVGYEIKPLYQGNNYSYHALEMMKVLAKKHGYLNILISCEPNNEQSKKTILKSGGKLVFPNYQIPKDHIYHVVGIFNVNVYVIPLDENGTIT